MLGYKAQKQALEQAQERIAELEEQLESSVNEAIEATNEEHVRAVDSLKATHAKEVQDLKAAHASDMATLKANHDSSLETAKAEHEKTVEKKANEKTVDLLASAAADVTVSEAAASEQATQSFEERYQAARNHGGVTFSRFIRDHKAEIQEYRESQ